MRARPIAEPSSAMIGDPDMPPSIGIQSWDRVKGTNCTIRQRFVGWVMKLKRGGSGRSKPTIMSGGPSSPPSLL